jgi:UDP-N-acetylglucosamine 3-dehydrogenase
LVAKIVVVGAGGFGKNHVRVLNDLGSLAGVIDINEEVAKKYGSFYRVAWSTNLDSFNFNDIDGAVISTPTSTHKEIAVKLIEKGIKYLLVEKPFVATLKEAVELLEFSKGKDVKFFVGFIERFNQAVELSKNYLSEGKIGKPIILHALRVRSWPDRPIDLGVIKDTSIHDIDLSLYLFGSMPKTVYARSGSIAHSINEDHATIILNFSEETRAVIDSNWLTPSKSRKLTITGTLGLIDADLITQEVILRNGEGAFVKRTDWKEPLLFELKSFIKCIEEKTDPSPNQKDAILALAIAEAALVSSKNNQVVSVPELLAKYHVYDL